MIFLTKKYKTRGGQRVFNLSFFNDEHYPICGYIDFGETDSLARWTEDGRFCSDSAKDHCYDLVEVVDDRNIIDRVAEKGASVLVFDSLVKEAIVEICKELRK